MKRKMLTKLLSATMIATMMLSMSVFADDTVKDWNTDGGQGTVEGEGTVITPVIEIGLPGDMSFQIDPFMVDSGDKQIVAGDYNIVNYGNVAVGVDVYPTIIKDANSNLDVATAATLVTGDTTKYADLTPVASKKAVFLTAIAADKVTEGTAVNTLDTDEDGIYEFAYTAGTGHVGRAKTATTKAADPVTTFGAATAGAATGSQIILKGAAAVNAETAGAVTAAATGDKLSFVVKEAKLNADTGAYEPNLDSIASFTFGGAVDAHAEFEDGDVAVQTIFQMKLLTKNDKAKLKADANKQAVYTVENN